MSKPLFCQVIFGRHAGLRVWFIVDGDTVYLDRTGGDTPRIAPCANERDTEFPIELADSDGLTRYRITSAAPLRDENRRALLLTVDISGPTQYGQYGTSELADDPSHAGVAHIHGPLTIQAIQRAGQSPLTFVADGTQKYVQAMVTTARRGSWIAVRSERNDESAFPPGIVPMVDVDFPPKIEGGQPVHRQFALDEFC